jgi:ADP-ribose pyrophosphatase
MIRDVSRERLFSGKLFDVVREDGKDVVVHGPAVAVVAIDAQDRVVLVRQERAGAGGRTLLELPAGGVEEGEDLLATARRELQEETGLHGGDWRPVSAFFTSPGFTDEVIHLFLATGLEEGDASPDEGEELEVVRVPLDAVPTLLETLEDAKTLVGLQMLTAG